MSLLIKDLLNPKMTTVFSLRNLVLKLLDDIVVTGNDFATIAAIKGHLNEAFGIKDLGKLNYFLGIEVGNYPSSISLTRHKFTRELYKIVPLIFLRKHSRLFLLISSSL